MRPGDRVLVDLDDLGLLPGSYIETLPNGRVRVAMDNGSTSNTLARRVRLDARARFTDPPTSHQAAARQTSDKIRSDQALVMRIHAEHPTGLTDFELAAHAGRQQTSLGKRRGELRDAGLIKPAGVTRPAPSGSPAQVWRLTAAGWAHVRDGAA